jgi:hypothetical protein
MHRVEIDREFWKAYLALEQTLKALNEAVQGRPSEKAKPPKPAGVTLSIGCQEFYMNSEGR